MQIRNRTFQADVQQVFRKAPFIHELGVRLKEIQPGVCWADLVIQPNHLQHLHRVHGGVISSLAGHCALGAAMSLAGAGETLVTPEFTFRMLRPVQAECITCKAEVIKPGAVLIFTEAYVYDGTNEDEKLIARGSFMFSRA